VRYDLFTMRRWQASSLGFLSVLRNAQVVIVLAPLRILSCRKRGNFICTTILSGLRPRITACRPLGLSV
jgi:hypothetical protein